MILNTGLCWRETYFLNKILSTYLHMILLQSSKLFSSYFWIWLGLILYTWLGDRIKQRMPDKSDTHSVVECVPLNLKQEWNGGRGKL